MKIDDVTFRRIYKLAEYIALLHKDKVIPNNGHAPKILLAIEDDMITLNDQIQSDKKNKE